MNQDRFSLEFGLFVETEVPADELIVSRTDMKGVITYANETFAEISGYTPAQLIGKPHNIVRHPDMPSSVFSTLWSTIRAKKTWRGYVKNLRKDGGYYWVEAEVSGVYKNGILTEYKSIRSPVSSAMKQQMQNRYDKLRLEEDALARSAAYLSRDNIEKLMRLAAEESTTINDILNRAIEQL